MTTSGQRCASDGTSKTLRGTQTAVIQTTPDAQTAIHRRKATMMIRQIKNDWFRLDTDGLVFFGYSREHVLHKLEAWVREHDLRRVR
tara:strand:+ start:669 stop:929 length:261 start_codon:yes stop_codon:yes gene_type:complete